MQSFLDAVLRRAKDAATTPEETSATPMRKVFTDPEEITATPMRKVFTDPDLVRLIGSHLPVHARERFGSKAKNIWCNTPKGKRCARCSARCACQLFSHELDPYTKRKQDVLRQLRLGHTKKLRHLGPVARDDHDVVRAAIENFGARQLAHASMQRRDDGSLIAWAVTRDPSALRFASARLRDCPRIVHAAVSKYPLSVWYTSERIRREDEQLVWEAIARTRNCHKLDGSDVAMSNLWQWFGAIQHVVVKLKQPWNNLCRSGDALLPHQRALVRIRRSRLDEVTRGSLRSFNGASTKLRAALVLEAIEKQWSGAAEHFWKDRAFVLAACAAYAPVLRDERIDAAFRDDEGCVRAAAEAAHGFDEIEVLGVASQRLRADKTLVLSLLQKKQQPAACLRHAAERLRDDDDVVLGAVRRDGIALAHASTRLRASWVIAVAACKSNGLALRYCDSALRDDATFVTSAESLQFASDRLRDDDDLVQRLVKQGGRETVLKHASKRLQMAYEERYEAAAGAGYARLRMQRR